MRGHRCPCSQSAAVLTIDPFSVVISRSVLNMCKLSGQRSFIQCPDAGRISMRTLLQNVNQFSTSSYMNRGGIIHVKQHTAERGHSCDRAGYTEHRNIYIFAKELMPVM